ncbi:MAG: hypothetical protein FWE16_02905 [Firmicutes bacterium]|nr:hypothetical protein [Bacillota bacterium]
MNGSQITRIVVATLASMFLVFSYGIGIFGFLFPGVMLNMADNMGLRGAGAMFSQRVYNRDGGAENLYIALDRAIHASRYSRVVELYEKFIGYEEKQDVIDMVNTFNWNNALVNERALVANEGDRLFRAYVNALIQLNRVDDAVDAAMDVFAQPIDLQQPTFVYFSLVGNDRLMQPQRDKLRTDFILYFNLFHDEFNNADPSGNERVVPQHFIDFVLAYLE